MLDLLKLVSGKESDKTGAQEKVLLPNRFAASFNYNDFLTN
jgi:hypothetical protein